MKEKYGEIEDIEIEVDKKNKNEVIYNDLLLHKKKELASLEKEKKETNNFYTNEKRIKQRKQRKL